MKVNFYRKVEGSLLSPTARLRDNIKEKLKKGAFTKTYLLTIEPTPFFNSA